MKRYLLFAGDDYYPQGGMSDFVDSFNTPQEAYDSYAPKYNAWYQIVDYQTLEVIYNDTDKPFIPSSIS